MEVSVVNSKVGYFKECECYSVDWVQKLPKKRIKSRQKKSSKHYKKFLFITEFYSEEEKTKLITFVVFNLSSKTSFIEIRRFPRSFSA